MNAHDALELGQLLQPTTTYPVHYEGWTHFHQGRAEIERIFAHAASDALGHIVWPPSGRPQRITA